jgi:hypothetical protein
MKTLFPIIFIVIAIGVFLTVGKPINDDIKTLKVAIKEHNQALDNSKELQKTRDDLLGIYNSVTIEDKNRLDAFLPNNANNIELVLQIQEIARRYDMPLSNIKFDPIGVKEDNSNSQTTTVNTQNPISLGANATLPYGVFNLEFTIEGDYEVFRSFLKELEDNLRLISVKSITFSSPATNNKNASGKDLYAFNLKIETYWFKN